MGAQAFAKAVAGRRCCRRVSGIFSANELKLTGGANSARPASAGVADEACRQRFFSHFRSIVPSSMYNSRWELP
jgi:hypothetical protein